MNQTKIKAALAIADPSGLGEEPREEIARAIPSRDVEDVEAVLAFALSNAVDVWREALLASYAPTFFAAFVRARERFEGIAAGLARGLPPALAEGSQRHDLAVWEHALAPDRGLALREPQGQACASPATDGAAADETAVQGLPDRPSSGAWARFPQLIFGFGFRGFPALIKANEAFRRLKPEAKSLQKVARWKYLARPEIKRKRAEEARHYREHKHAEILAQPWFARRLEQRDAHYHRPFVAIDFEGMKYADRNVTHNGVVWPIIISF
jgi:hypothetical protein